jgi:hypothetical protein
MRTLWGVTGSTNLLFTLRLGGKRTREKEQGLFMDGSGISRRGEARRLVEKLPSCQGELEVVHGRPPACCSAFEGLHRDRQVAGLCPPVLMTTL